MKLYQKLRIYKINRYLLPFFVLILFCIGTNLQAKQYTVEKYDVKCTIHPQNILLMQEDVSVRFLKGNFTYFQRELRTEKTDGIEVDSIAIDGATIPLIDGKNLITKNKRLYIRWDYPTAKDTIMTFTVHYRMYGVVTKVNDLNELKLITLPTKHSYNIQHASIAFYYPNKGQLFQGAGILKGRGSIISAGDSTIINRNFLLSDESITAILHFQKGLIEEPPVWMKNKQKMLIYLILFSILDLVIIILTILYLHRFLKTYSLNYPVHKKAVFTPPSSKIPPAEAAWLIRYVVPVYYITQAILLDLVRRGVIILTKGDKKWGRSTIYPRTGCKPRSAKSI